MSLSQRSLGCCEVKSRLMRFGDALAFRESLVTRNGRIALGRISALRISLATVLRQHGTFWASSSTCTLGAPYDSCPPRWMLLIRVRRWPRRRPRCRATWALGFSLNAVWRTASSLNCRVNFLRGVYSIERLLKSVLLSLRCPSNVGTFIPTTTGPGDD